MCSIQVYRVLPSRIQFFCILLGFPRSYLVLLSFTGFYWVSLSFIQYNRILLGFTGFYWVLLGFTGFYWVSPGFVGFYRVLYGISGCILGFTGFIGFLLGFTGFYRVLPSCTGFYRILQGKSTWIAHCELLLSFIGLCKGFRFLARFLFRLSFVFHARVCVCVCVCVCVDQRPWLPKGVGWENVGCVSLYLDCGRRPSFVHYTFSASLLCRVMDVDFFGLFLWPPFCLVCRCARYATRACDVRDLPQALFECVMSTLPGLLGFTGFYWVLLFFFVSTKVPLGSPVFYWVCLVLFIQSQLSFIGCYRAELSLPGCTGFVRVWLGLTRFD